MTWAIKGRTLIADCDCRGYRYNDGWYAHVASLWWQGVRGQIAVTHLDTGQEYSTPPCWLRLDDRVDYDGVTSAELDACLTSAELDACLTCDVGGVGVVHTLDTPTVRRALYRVCSDERGTLWRATDDGVTRAGAKTHSPTDAGGV